MVKEQRKLGKAIKKTKRKGKPVDAADISRNKGLIGCWLWLQKDGKAVDLADPKLNFGLKVEAKAIAEGNSYINSNRPRDRNSSINCYGYGFDSYSCSRSSGGGWAAGILKAWDEADNRNAGKKLAKAVAKACMADYGWVKK